MHKEDYNYLKYLELKLKRIQIEKEISLIKKNKQHIKELTKEEDEVLNTIINTLKEIEK